MLAVDTIPLRHCRFPISNCRFDSLNARRQSAIESWHSAMLFRFLMIRVLTAAATELLKLQPIRSSFLVLRSHVIAAFAITALQHNVIAWHKSFPIGTRASRALIPKARRRRAYPNYSTTSETVPAPTVRPPSRIAKRKPFSIAIGAINSISICTLSPGITISTPCGRCATPVTSVVRK